MTARISLVPPNVTRRQGLMVVCLFGTNTKWSSDTTQWSVKADGAILGDSAFQIGDITYAAWAFTLAPKSGPGYITISDGQYSAVFAVKA